jgi:hypothetical protein
MSSVTLNGLCESELKMFRKKVEDKNKSYILQQTQVFPTFNGFRDNNDERIRQKCYAMRALYNLVISCILFNLCLSEFCLLNIDAVFTFVRSCTITLFTATMRTSISHSHR